MRKQLLDSIFFSTTFSIKCSFLVLFFFILSSSVISQNKEKIDSLLHIIETPKLDTITVNAYCGLSSELVGVDNEQAKSFALKGLAISNEIKDAKMQGYANHVTGIVYDYMGVADSALIHYEKSIEIKRTLNDLDGEASTLLNIGVLYFYQKDYEKSLFYAKQSLEMYKKLNNEKRTSAALNNIGATYRLLKKYDEAIETYNEALELKEKVNDSLGMTSVFLNLGIAYQNKEMYAEAEAYLLKSLAIQKKLDDESRLINTYITLANLNIEQEKFTAGKEYIEKSIEVGKRKDLPHEMSSVYKLYAYLDNLTGDYESAYTHLNEYIKLKDQFEKADRKKEMDKLETVYQTKEKEKEIEVSNTIIKNRNKALWVISIIVAVLLILAFWLFWLRYKLHKSNKQLNILVKQKEDLVKEIHHRVKNNLQVISSLLNMHVRKVEDPQSKKIFDDGISRIQAMSLIHQNIYSHSSLQQLKPKDYIEKLVQQLFITYQIPDKSIKITTDIEDMDLDIEKLMSLGLILNEILSNAFKYAFNGSQQGEIDISMKTISQNKVELKVKDSGKGITIEMMDASANSLGMRLINAFSEKLDAEMNITNTNGTEYKLVFNPN